MILRLKIDLSVYGFRKGKSEICDRKRLQGCQSINTPDEQIVAQIFHRHQYAFYLFCISTFAEYLGRSKIGSPFEPPDALSFNNFTPLPSFHPYT